MSGLLSDGLVAHAEPDGHLRASTQVQATSVRHSAQQTAVVVAAVAAYHVELGKSWDDCRAVSDEDPTPPLAADRLVAGTVVNGPAGSKWLSPVRAASISNMYVRVESP